jgi:hypothetical protein
MFFFNKFLTCEGITKVGIFFKLTEFLKIKLLTNIHNYLKIK